MTADRRVEAVARAIWDARGKFARSGDWPTWGELLAQGHQGQNRLEDTRREAAAALAAADAVAPSRYADRMRQTVGVLQTLVADLSDALTDEGDNWTHDGVDALRRRVANAVPPDQLPDWLAEHRDPAVVQSASPPKGDGDEQ